MPLDQDLTEFTTASPVIVTYDFTDFASGVAFQTFFLADSDTASGITRLLTQTARPQSGGTHQVVTAAGDIDFDLSPFDGTRVVSGTATFGGHMPTSSDNVTVTIKKFSKDSVETDVSSAITANANAEDIFFEIPLTETVFNVGDILRVTINVGGTNGALNIDPLGLTGAPSRIDIPFKTQL